MDTTKRQAAERIRPILEAMERSIDSARRRRVNTGASQPQSPALPTAPTSPLRRIETESVLRDELIAPPPQKLNMTGHQRPEPPVFPQRDSSKLKARPKRPAGFATSGQPPFYGAKVG
jgi:hypothetical protein